MVFPREDCWGLWGDVVGWGFPVNGGYVAVDIQFYLIPSIVHVGEKNIDLRVLHVLVGFLDVRGYDVDLLLLLMDYLCDLLLEMLVILHFLSDQIELGVP